MQTKLFIGGEFVEAADGATIDVLDPHDGSLLARVAEAKSEDVDRAVAAATAAKAGWARMAAADRGRLLLRLADAIEADIETLALLETRDTGHPIRDTRNLDVPRTAATFRYFGGMADKFQGSVIPVEAGFLDYVTPEPLGVVGQIVPWNFPASLFGTKLAPALAAGCGFLVKPAESTSLITMRLAEIAKPHLPEGLLNVVIGGGAIAAILVAHPGIRRVAFTGSTDVGRMVAVAGSAEFKRYTLELGGCDPFVLLKGTDLKAAVRALGGTRFYNAGQVCVAPKRLIVERSQLDETVDLLQERLSRFVLGNSAVSPTASMGPLHTFDSRARLLDQIEDAVKHGAKQIGARVPTGEGLDGGSYLEPGLLIDPSPSARVRVEETFGPVLTVIPFDTDDEAVQIANETPFGLGASVWGPDMDRCMNIMGHIDSGYKWVNALGRVYDELPFGGVKESGVGREHGIEGLDSYLEDISIIVGTGS